MSQITLKTKIKTAENIKKLKFKRWAAGSFVNNAKGWFNNHGVPEDIQEKFIEAASARPYTNERGKPILNDELAVRLFILWLFKTSIKLANPLNVPSLSAIKEPNIEIPEIPNEDNKKLVDETFDKLKALMKESIKNPVEANKEYSKIDVSDVQPMFLTIKGAGADPSLIKKIKEEIKKVKNYLKDRDESVQTQWAGKGVGGHGGAEEINISKPITWKKTADFIGKSEIIKKGIATLKYNNAYLKMTGLDEDAIKVINSFSPEDMKELIKKDKIKVVKSETNLSIEGFDKTVLKATEFSGNLWSMPNIMELYLNNKESLVLSTPKSTIGWSNNDKNQLESVGDWIQNQGLDEDQTTKRFIREEGQLIPAYSGSGDERVIYKPEVFEPWGFGRVRMKEETYEESIFGTYLNGSPILMPSGLPEGCNMMGDPRISGSNYPSKSEYDNLLKDLTWSDMYAASLEYHEILKSKDIKVFKNYKEQGHIILELSNGWYWVDLETNQSSEEAKRMGHCGNESSAFTLFSLRHNETVKKTKDYKSKTYTQNKSWATVAVLKDGTFIQFKGHGNGVPSSIIHPQISLLLSSKLNLKDGFTGKFASTKQVQPLWNPYSLSSNPAFPKLSNCYGTDFSLVQMAESSPEILKDLVKKRPDFFDWKDANGNRAETDLTKKIDAVIKEKQEKTAKKY